jgi:CubicO group peptidase (beta-lactamase class C family)
MRRLLAALAVSIVAPALAWAAPPAGFEGHVEALRKSAGDPGITVALVEDGRVSLARGFGVRGLKDPRPVDADTIFQIGSVSKAFTAAALATLIDEGRIRWDAPVIDYMPEFRMYDPWVTRELTVRDLLVHRSGLCLGQGDLMMVPATTISRAELVRRLRYLKPCTSFRSAYAYDNVLYAAAGQLIEEVTGKPWEQYVAERILRPVGMTDAVTSDQARFSAPNRALPHGRLGEVRGTGPLEAFDEKGVALSANSAPAGAIAASANDMAKWIRTQLAAGQAPGGQRVFSAASRDEMWKGVVPVTGGVLTGVLGDAQPKFRLYGLGWSVSDYRGHQILSHGGGVLGSITTIVLIPEKNTGFAIMINSEDSALLAGLQNELLDHYLGFPGRDWPKAYRDFLDQRSAQAVAAVKASVQARPKSRPSLPLSGYAGTYADPWYGPMSVSEKDGKLWIDFQQTPQMKGPLEHWAYDTFVARFPGSVTTEPAYVTFALGADGKPRQVTMKAVSPIADFSFDYHDLNFTPVAAK